MWKTIGCMKLSSVMKNPEFPMPAGLLIPKSIYEFKENKKFAEWAYFGIFDPQFTGVGRRVHQTTNEVQEGQFSKGLKLGFVRTFLPSGQAEVATYRVAELRHEIYTKFNELGQLVFKSQWKDGNEVKIIFSDDPDGYEAELRIDTPKIVTQDETMLSEAAELKDDDPLQKI